MSKQAEIQYSCGFAAGWLSDKQPLKWQINIQSHIVSKGECTFTSHSPFFRLLPDIKEAI